MKLQTIVSANNVVLSQLNSTTLVIPASFKVQVIPNPDVPIDSEEIYRAAIDMMFEVSDNALDQIWPNKRFTSPIGPTVIQLTHNSRGKDPSQVNTQIIIWGLYHLMLSMTVSKLYCQTVAVLRWDDIAIGAIDVNPRRSPILTASSDGELIPLQGDKANSSSLSHFFDRAVTVKIAYGQTPVDRNLIYLTGIKAMGDAAQMGLDEPCNGMISSSIRVTKWSLIREPGHGVPEFKAGYSRIAAFRALGKIIMDQKFLETFVIMDVEGLHTAVGGVTQGIAIDQDRDQAMISDNLQSK